MSGKATKKIGGGARAPPVKGGSPMNKQLTLLYILLIFLQAMVIYSFYSLLTMDTTPDVLEEYQEYQKLQKQITLQEETQPSEAEKGIMYLDYDLEALLAANPDFDSWLMIPDTPVSFPVVRSSDNFYYLDRDFENRSSAYGCLYFDVNCPPGSDNRVIHGHNMGINRDEMFSTLVLYQDPDYAAQHKFAYLSNAPDGAADQYELFAVVNFDLQELLGFDYAKPNFDSEQDRAAFIAYLQERSLYDADHIPGGKLLILSTCNRDFGAQNRLLICLGETN